MTPLHIVRLISICHFFYLRNILFPARIYLQEALLFSTVIVSSSVFTENVTEHKIEVPTWFDQNLGHCQS